jgi:hypothetical protein
MQEPGHQPPDRAGELSRSELVNRPHHESLHNETMNDRDCTPENPGDHQRGVVQIHDGASIVRVDGKSLVLMSDASSFSKQSVHSGRPVFHSVLPQLVV